MGIARFLPLAIAPGQSSVDETASQPESALVRSAAGGNRAAVESLYLRYARMVHGILLTRVRPSDAEDLVHDVFITAMRKLSALRSPEAFSGWLAAIARNRAVEHYRQLRLKQDAERNAALTDVLQPESKALEVLEIIRQLPEAYRETLILRLVEGMTGPEIADKTGLKPDSVRVNLFRGMKLLRERLTRREVL